MPAKFVHPILRFFKYVNRDGPVPANDPTLGPCEQWTGCTTDRGRAVFTQDGNYFHAAKWHWLYFNGPVPKGLCVCHLCNNVRCVRLSHLTLGTSPDNNSFRSACGRNRNPLRRLMPKITKPPRKTLKERFESCVLVNDGCWLWGGSLNQDGYGHMWNGKSCEGTHRISWELYYGPIPVGLKVLHDCHVRRCCNPFHLHLGTQLKNNQEREAAGRGKQPHGEKHGRAKLTADQVLEIRRLHATGEWSHNQLALKFGVSNGTIWCIINRRNWAWL